MKRAKERTGPLIKGARSKCLCRYSQESASFQLGEKTGPAKKGIRQTPYNGAQTEVPEEMFKSGRGNYRFLGADVDVRIAAYGTVERGI